MLVLTINSCPDSELIGDYTFYYPLVRIGRSYHTNLPVGDVHIGKSVLCLKPQSDGILIWEEKSGFYYSNGKKISGRKLHQVGDHFGIGESQFQIKTFSPPAVKLDVEKRYHDLTESHPFMADLFWALKQEMLKIEKDGEG